MTIRRIAIPLLAVVVCCSTPGLAQTPTTSTVQQLLQQLQDPNWTVRSAAFYGLLNLGSGANVSGAPYNVPPRVANLLSQYATQADQIEVALIALLSLEDPNLSMGYQALGQPQINEDETEYYADLVAAVASLQDPRAINSLVGAVLTGDIAISPLASFGDRAADLLIQQLTSATDDLSQFSSLLTLEKMLDPANFPSISTATQAKLRQAFQFASTLSDPDTAFEAKQALSKLNSLAPSDTIPPITTASISPSSNAAGWNNTNLRVSLISTDNEPSGTGVKQITYSAAGAQTIASTVVNGASAYFAISAEGVTTVTFFGTDNAGNVESAKTLTIQLDKTPPTITPGRTPPPNTNGWNNTNVTVSFVCADGLSGLAAGSPPAPTTLSSEGAGQSVTGTCTDVAGNSASATVSGINIDKTPPVITASTNPSTLWPPNGKMVNAIVSGTMTDNLSGLDPNSATFAVVDSYGLVQPSGNVTVSANGSYSFTVALEARRDGQDQTGRLYTITVSGRDKAGNPSSASTTVVVPHDQGQ